MNPPKQQAARKLPALFITHTYAHTHTHTHAHTHTHTHAHTRAHTHTTHTHVRTHTHIYAQMDPLRAASHGFFVNHNAVMLRLSGPFLDPTSPNFWKRCAVNTCAYACTRGCECVLAAGLRPSLQPSCSY
jgi:hypothetical protein